MFKKLKRFFIRQIELRRRRKCLEIALRHSYRPELSYDDLTREIYTLIYDETPSFNPRGKNQE